MSIVMGSDNNDANEYNTIHWYTTRHFSAISQLSTEVTNKKTQCDDDVTAKHDVCKEVSILFPRDIVE